jgi:predicted MPP superfamily phosphohydrolase
LPNPFDIFLWAVFALAQARVTLLLVRVASRRLGGIALRAVQLALILWQPALIAGYLCTYAELVSRWRLRPRRAMIAGAATLIYLLLATTAVVVYAIWKALRKKLWPEIDPARRRMLKTVGIAVASLPPAVLAYGGLVERSAFRVREVDVPIPDLHADLAGFRIAQVSDIHLSAFLSKTELARVIDATNELRPNLTVVTGDLISSAGDPLDHCIREIARLRSDAGVYGCLGNHERYAKAEDYTEIAAGRLGVRFLRDAAVPLRFGAGTLNLVGVDYQPVDRRFPYLHGAQRHVVPGACNLLLSHNPKTFPAAARQGYDLTLAGHTHGGQVTVEILDMSVNPAAYFTRYVYGLYHLGRASAYVTRGIGTIGIPVRIGAPPEITLLRLRKA